jgi:hypothetical protein
VPVSGTATSNAEATEAMPPVRGRAAIAVPGDGHSPGIEMSEALNRALIIYGRIVERAHGQKLSM